MSNRPNILWIVTTQWRGQACGYAGDANAWTPMIDALAAQSVNYAQAVTPHPFGPMARAALLTGVGSPENGVRDYFDTLPADARTIAHKMKACGYATAFFGKWGVGRRDPTVPLVGEAAAQVIVPEGERGGFEFWEGFEGGFLLNDPWLHGTLLAEPVRVPGYQSDVVSERAARWLTERPTPNAQRPTPNEESVGGPSLPAVALAKADGPALPAAPWFCVVSLEAPHPPYDAPASGVERREVELVGNVPRGGEVEAKARRELAGYYAHIAATDRAIGRLVTAVGEDTVVVVTSVHGDMHGAHGLFRKGWPHEESVRVPLLVRHPREMARREDATVSLLDLPAMTRAWAEGRAWGETRTHAAISMPSVVALPNQCDRVWRGVRTPRRKLVLNGDGTPWLFFDLERDPLEQTNLTGDPRWAGEIAALREVMSEK